MGSKAGIAWALASAACLLLPRELHAQAPSPSASAAPPSASFTVEPEPTASPPATPAPAPADAAAAAQDMAPAPPAPTGATPSPPAIAPPVWTEPPDTNVHEAESEDEDATAFGDPGQLVIAGGFDLSLGHTSYSRSDDSIFTLNLTPSADYFVAQHISIGGYLDFRHREDSAPYASSSLQRTTNSVGIGVRAGIDVPLGKRFSFWVQGGVAYATARAELAVPDTSASLNGQTLSVQDSSTARALAIRFFAPFLIHPVAHFFVGLGPQFSTDVFHEVDVFENRVTFFGVTTTVGGWF